MKNKIVFLFSAAVTVSSAMEMELTELKKNQQHVSSELIDKVIKKIPQIAKILATEGVMGYLQLSDIITQPVFSWSTIMHPQYKFEVIMSPNHLKGTSVMSEKAIAWYYQRAKNMYDEVWLDESALRNDCSKTKLMIDGPNSNGVTAGCVIDNHANNTINVTTWDHLYYNSIKNLKQAIWSVALSDDNRFVVSSMVEGQSHASLFSYTISKEIKTKKFIFTTTQHRALFDEKGHKHSTLEGDRFHLFKKMSFLHENLLLGLDQQGKLYSIVPHFDDSQKDPEFYCLNFKKQGSRSYLTNFAVDAYDKHCVVLVDNNENVYIGRITAKKLAVKKITNLKNMYRSLDMPRNSLSLGSVYLHGNKVCFFLNTAVSRMKINLRLTLISKEQQL